MFVSENENRVFITQIRYEHSIWHIQGDALGIINGRCGFETVDGTPHEIIGKWDLIIAHPPCTYLSGAGTRHYSLNCTPADKVVARMEKREKAACFFMQLYYADCEHVAVENPQGRMNTLFRKPDQTISPYMFAESEDDEENYHQKRTCLWLKGLPPLVTRNIPCPKPICTYINHKGKKKNVTWEMAVCGRNQTERASIRSKTFPGIAKAMAEQWGSCAE